LQNFAARANSKTKRAAPNRILLPEQASNQNTFRRPPSKPQIKNYIPPLGQALNLNRTSPPSRKPNLYAKSCLAAQ